MEHTHKYTQWSITQAWKRLSNAICSNTNGPRDYQARERQVSYAITHIWNPILKNNTNELIHKTEILTDIENKLNGYQRQTVGEA